MRRGCRLVGSVGLASLLVPGLVYTYGRRIGRNRLVVERVDLPLPGLPPSLFGFRLVHMSDFHLHPYTKIDLVRRAVARANALRPDAVVLTGDYVLEEATAVWELGPALARLQAPHGVFAVLGNHDVARGPATIRAGLAAAGITVLDNAHRVLAVGEGRLVIAGVENPGFGRPDLDAALAGAPPHAPRILLAHEPDFADIFMREGRVQVQLSGHTHGGQIRLPGRGPLVLPTNGRKYHSGLYRLGDGWVYTTRGVGVNGIPLRINCPPEITLLTLRAADPANPPSTGPAATARRESY